MLLLNERSSDITLFIIRRQHFVVSPYQDRIFDTNSCYNDAGVSTSMTQASTLRFLKANSLHKCLPNVS